MIIPMILTLEPIEIVVKLVYANEPAPFDKMLRLTNSSSDDSDDILPITVTESGILTDCRLRTAIIKSFITNFCNSGRNSHRL